MALLTRRLARSLPRSLGAAALIACGNSTPSTVPDASTPSIPGTDAALDAPAPRVDAATPDSGVEASAPDAGAPLTVTLDATLAGFPHLIDLYVPARPERLVVFLHGGGGTKDGAADQLSLRVAPTSAGAPPTYDEAWLTSHRVAFAIPQGQALPGTNGRTWSNYVMDSGVDDVAFLRALAAAARAGTLHASLPAVAKVHVAGHSNGGMMANRLWCEAPDAFDGFAALAGPASTALGPAGAHPCQPVVAKPYLGYVGGKDTVLQTLGHWTDDVWTIAPVLASTPGFVDPTLVNELTFHETVRVPATCGGVVAAPTFGAGGVTTTWSDCGGKVRLVRVTNAGHCIGPRASCTDSFETETGQRLVDVLSGFFAATAP